MRYSSEHKAESKRRILSAAARQIRVHGPQKVAVADVMTAAGLTHGAFYAHFESKDGLVAEAISEMFADAGRRAGGLRELADTTGEDLRTALRAYFEGYLSPAHRDRPERGCPLPSLAPDVARADARTRETFTAGMERVTGSLAGALDRLGRDEPAAEARAVVARMVGGVALARALGPGPGSEAVLRDCREAIYRELGL
mgnify:CR=1 FL=1